MDSTRIVRARARRFTAATGLVLASALVLVGCGRGDGEASPDGAGSAIDAEPATGEIELWAPTGDAETLDALLDDFRAENPDATVNVTIIPNSEYEQKIQAAIAAETLPDVVQIKTGGLLLTGAWAPVPAGLIEEEDFFPGALAMGNIDGTQYLVPWYAYPRVMVYRADLAESGGVQAPTTWEEWVPFLEGLRAGGAERGFGSDVGWDGNSGTFVMTLGLGAGVDYLGDDGRSWRIDTPEMIEALELYASFFEDDLTSPDGPAFLDQNSAFISGEIGSLVTGPWVIAQLTEAQGEDWVAEHVGVALLPAGSEGSIGNIGGGGWTVVDGSDNSESSWKLIRYLAEVDTELAQYEAFGSMPPRQSAWEQGGLFEDPLMVPFFEQLQTGVAPPNVATWSQLLAMLGTQAERLARGSASPQEVAAEAQGLADSIGTGR